MKKLVATALIITFSVMLFGYGMATIGHKFLHTIENPFHTHGHVHQNDHDNGHGDEQEKGHDHHQTKSQIDHNKQDAAAVEHSHELAIEPGVSHDIDDHGSSLNQLNKESQNRSITEALSPLFLFTFSETIHKNKSIRQVILSESESRYLSFYQSLSQSTALQPPSL